MRMDKFLIGIDIGTQGTKAALYSEIGKCRAIAFEPSRLYQPAHGIVEEDPEYQVATVCKTIQACMNKSKLDGDAVAAIGIAGQMAGVLGIDKAGRAVTPYDSWLDTRCKAYIERMQKTAGQAILTKTGCAPSFNHGPKILWWMHERKETFKSVKSFVQPGGYAAMRLCDLKGSDAFIDTTYLHFSSFADNQKSQWDAALCEQFGMDPSLLPRIREPQEVIGEITPESAHRCGLPAGIPVVAGCGDTAASFLACGATTEGICVDVAGTASVFAATTAQFQPDLKNATLGVGQAVSPGLWHPYAYINGGGMNLEWFRNQVMPLPSSHEPRSLSELDDSASHIQLDPSLPMFIPHLGGRVSPAWPEMRGAWAGLTWKHSYPQLYRSLLEAVALEYCVYQEILVGIDSQFKPNEVRITGGGEKSTLWNQIKSDALGIPVVQMQHNEGSPKGAAMVAGAGVGLFKDVRQISETWCTCGARYEPNHVANRFYHERLQDYKALLDCMNQWRRRA